MYFLYLDEAGTGDEVNNLVLGGIIVKENAWLPINTVITNLKKEYCVTVYADLKGLRKRSEKYIDKKNKNYFHDLTKEQCNTFADTMFKVIFDSETKYLATIINKEKFHDIYPNENPYVFAYKLVLERFDIFLDRYEDLGLMYVELSDNQTKKNLERAHEHFIQNGTGWQTIKHILESCHFVFGQKNNFAQISDLFIHAIFRKYEHNNSTFYDKYIPKLDKKYDGQIEGYGIKYFP